MRSVVLAPAFALLLLTATLGVATMDGAAVLCAGSCAPSSEQAQAAAEATVQASHVLLSDLEAQRAALAMAAEGLRAAGEEALASGVEDVAASLAMLLADEN